jgi:hypothetical protein
MSVEIGPIAVQNPSNAGRKRESGGALKIDGLASGGESRPDRGSIRDGAGSFPIGLVARL